MEVKRQKQKEIEELRQSKLYKDQDLSLNQVKHNKISTNVPLFQDHELIRVIKEPDVSTLPYRKGLDFKENQFLKSEKDPHDQILRYFHQYSTSREEEEDGVEGDDLQNEDSQLQMKQGKDKGYIQFSNLISKNRSKRRNAGDNELMQLSKEHAFDNALSYDLLRQSLEDDAKQGKLQKHQGNCLAIVPSADRLQYQLIYPDHQKTHINVSRVALNPKTGSVEKVENVLSNCQLMFSQITQLETYNVTSILTRDYYNLQLSTIKDSKVSKVHTWSSKECLIKFKQSPYIAEDILVLTEESNFYLCSADQRQQSQSTNMSQIVFNYSIDKQKDREFRQDLNYFDFGFHPKCLLSGNFQNVFNIDMRANNCSLLVSSDVNQEDGSFNKISNIRRLDEFNHFALIDEEKFYIFDIRQTKCPQYVISHFLHEVVKFSDIVTSFNSKVQPPSIEEFNDLSLIDITSNPSGEALKPSWNQYMAFSANNPSQLVSFKVEEESYQKDDDKIIRQICKLADWEYNLILKGFKPSLVQTSSMYNLISKIRGCQFLELDDYTLIFTCDNIGGLYATVQSQDFKGKISYCKGIYHQNDIVSEINKNASEDKLIAQSNFEQLYTFKEIDCTEILNELIAK